MPARLTQEFVDAWLAEHRPDFEVDPGWVYVNSRTPIPGRCLVEGCGAECAPRLDHMKNDGDGHCAACGIRVAHEANRARGEAEVWRVAAERGYEVVGFFTRQYKNCNSGVTNQMFVALRCSCGNEWNVSQSDLCSAGRGCASCALSGFDTGKPADLYLLTRSKRGLQETQYGVSNVLDKRLAKHAANGWRLVDVISGPGDEILALENLIKGAMKAKGIYRREYHDEKYDGYTEAWNGEDGLHPFMSLDLLLGWAEAQTGLREEAA